MQPLKNRAHLVVRLEAPGFEKLKTLGFETWPYGVPALQRRALRPDLKRVSPELGKLNLLVLRREALGWKKMRQAVLKKSNECSEFFITFSAERPCGAKNSIFLTRISAERGQKSR